MKIRKLKNLWVCTIKVDGKPVEFVSRTSRTDAILLAVRGMGWEVVA
jgi:hypothetical protein